MTRLVGVEFLKLRTTRAWIGFLLALVVLSGIGTAGQLGGVQKLSLGSREFQRDLLSSSHPAGLIALLLGIMLVTVEWRHGTITRTFLVTPRRERVLIAKEIAAFLLGIVLGALAVAVVLAVAVPWLSAEDASLDVGGVSGLIGRIVLAAALWCALGVGFGAVVQSQTFALVAALLWIVVVETLLGALLGLVDLGHVADFLPGRALSSLGGVSGEGALAPAAAGAVGLAYVAVFGALGYVRVLLRDIT